MNLLKAPRQAEILFTVWYYENVGSGVATLEDLQRHSGLNPDRVRRIINNLVSKGLLVIDAKRGIKYIKLSPRGRDAVINLLNRIGLSMDEIKYKSVDEVLEELRSRVLTPRHVVLASRSILDYVARDREVLDISILHPRVLKPSEVSYKVFLDRAPVLIGDSWALGADLEHVAPELEKRRVYSKYAKDLSWVIRNHRLLAVLLPVWYAGRPTTYEALKEVLGATWYWPKLSRTSKDLDFYIQEAASHNLLISYPSKVYAPIGASIVELIDRMVEVLKSPTAFISKHWPSRIFEVLVYGATIRYVVSEDDLLNNPPSGTALAEAYSMMSKNNYTMLVEKAVKLHMEADILERVRDFLVPKRVLRYAPALRYVLEREDNIVIRLLRTIVASKPYPTIRDVASQLRMKQRYVENLLRALHNQGIVILTVRGVLTPYHVAYYTIDPAPASEHGNQSSISGSELIIRSVIPTITMHITELKEVMGDEWDIVVEMIEELSKRREYDVSKIKQETLLKMTDLIHLMKEFKIVKIEGSAIRLIDEKLFGNIVLVLRDLPVREYIDIGKDLEQLAYSKKLYELTAELRDRIVGEYVRAAPHKQ